MGKKAQIRQPRRWEIQTIAATPGKGALCNKHWIPGKSNKQGKAFEGEEQRPTGREGKGICWKRRNLFRPATLSLALQANVGTQQAGKQRAAELPLTAQSQQKTKQKTQKSPLCKTAPQRESVTQLLVPFASGLRDALGKL